MCGIFQQGNSSRKLLDLTLVQVHSIVMQYALDGSGFASRKQDFALDF